MKFKCRKIDILDNIQLVQGVTSTRSTIPILSNILMEIKPDGLRLTGTDLEVGIKTQAQADVDEPGTITVPARRFNDIIKEMPEDDIEIEGKNESISINCGKIHYMVLGLASKEFPQLPDFPEKTMVSLEKRKLREMIRKTIFAVLQENSRHALCGVLVNITKNRLRMVSTDGHRLALVDEIIENGPEEDIEEIVPFKAMNELYRLMDNNGNLDISIEKQQIFFRDESMLLISRLIEGQFPNYDKVIPKTFEKQVFIDTQKLFDATRRISIMNTDKKNTIKYTLTGSNMNISSSNPDVGEATEDMDVEYDGENFTIIFNAKYCMDVLKNIDTDTVVLKLNDPLSLGALVPKDSDSEIFVIMPIRT